MKVRVFLQCRTCTTRWADVELEGGVSGSKLLGDDKTPAAEIPTQVFGQRDFGGHIHTVCSHPLRELALVVEVFA